MMEKPDGLELKPRIIELLKKRFEYINSFEGEPETLMKHLYKTADIIYREQVKPNAVCPSSGGCSYCCHVPVQITTIEADYIQKMTGIDGADLFKNSILPPDNSPCPFLKKSMCSIYEYRPLNCRVFASMDSVEYCKKGNEKHWITTVESTPALMELSSTLLRASKGTKYATFADIRHWFPTKKINVKNI